MKSIPEEETPMDFANKDHFMEKKAQPNLAGKKDFDVLNQTSTLMK